MGLYDFFFPHEAQAFHTRLITENQTKLMQHQVQRARRIARKASQSEKKSTVRKIKDLEDDLGFLTLLIAGMLVKLDEKGVINKEDLKETLHEVDGTDGEFDKKLSIDILRGISF